MQESKENVAIVLRCYSKVSVAFWSVEASRVLSELHSKVSNRSQGHKDVKSDPDPGKNWILKELFAGWKHSSGKKNLYPHETVLGELNSQEIWAWLTPSPPLLL